MTEKMIIDGVNVSKCQYYDDEVKFCALSYTGADGLLKNTKNPKRCQKSPNCYYKQLARKTEECKDLYKANEEKNELLQKLGISASGEVKRVKYYIDKLNSQYKAVVEQNKSLQQELQAEKYKVEELEKNLEQYKLYKELDEFIEKHSENQGEPSETYKFFIYKQALEEIKEICLNCKANNISLYRQVLRKCEVLGD